MRDLMTTHEVADYLRVKERKVYSLVQSRQIPCTRVTGKWLFPRALVDMWVLRNTEFSGAPISPPTPHVIGGSDDPLLEWAVRESGSDLAVLFDGSLDGVQRVAQRQACACGMHVIDTRDGGYNIHVVASGTVVPDAVLIQWAWRDQGLVTAPGNPLRIHSFGDVLKRKARFVARQASAGSHLLANDLLAREKIKPQALNRLALPARNERDAALAVADGHADVALAIAAVARQYRLGFEPLHRERYDLLIRRRDYFDQPLQALLGFARTQAFVDKAHALGGYNTDDLGRVMYNPA